MKIVTKQEFMELPSGTLYCNYRKNDKGDGVVDDLLIKMDTDGNNIFNYHQLTPEQVGDREELYEVYHNKYDDRLMVPFDYEVADRDDLFLVYESEEKKQFMLTVIKLLGEDLADPESLVVQ